MAKRPRKNHGAAYKAKVALEAIIRRANACRTGGAIPNTSKSDHRMEERAIE